MEDLALNTQLIIITRYTNLFQFCIPNKALIFNFVDRCNANVDGKEKRCFKQGKT